MSTPQNTIAIVYDCAERMVEEIGDRIVGHRKFRDRNRHRSRAETLISVAASPRGRRLQRGDFFFQIRRPFERV